MKKYAIIVAGGKGVRMGKEIPKQFIPIGGIPILMRTIQAFYDFDPDITIILALPQDQQVHWQTLCKEYHFEIPVIVVNGGNTRYQSVKNALDKIETEGIVAVHDGVRPFVSKEILTTAYETAAQKGSAIPVIPVTDSIRKIGKNQTSFACNRSNYCFVQTPQTFKIGWLKQAYSSPYHPDFTDDASVVEQSGFNVFTINGHPQNIKITTPIDLILAETFLKP